MSINEARPLGQDRLSAAVIERPIEYETITPLNFKQYTGWEAILEAHETNMLTSEVTQVEISPTLKCSEDCQGCQDRISLHLDDSPEIQIGIEEWKEIIDRLEAMGANYFLIIGGTVDRHHLTPELMAYISSKDQPVDFGWFTDGIPLLNAKTGEPNERYQRLVEEGNILNGTTHVSVDYLVYDGAYKDGAILDSFQRWDETKGGSRYYKSAFGLRLAKRLIQDHAKRVVINTALSARNIPDARFVYNHATALQEYAKSIDSPTVVLHTISPWVWRPHLARGDDQRNYDLNNLLRQSHQPFLNSLASYLLTDTQQRIIDGLPRVSGNSSGFITGLPEFAVTQDVPYNHGVEVLAVQPNGTVQVDPIFTSSRMLPFARNPYGYRDRVLENNPFQQYNDVPEESQFLNLIQTTRGNVQWH